MKKIIYSLIFVLFTIPIYNCGTVIPATTQPEIDKENQPDSQTIDQSLADVVSVKASGGPGAYTFSVEITSPDLGCNQYADWWEVIDGDGYLVYRRVLAHSHVNEQPFTRSGGPVEIDPDAPVYIRAHMHPGGYGGRVFQGSVEDGFSASVLSPGFAADLESAPPLPDNCAF